MDTGVVLDHGITAGRELNLSVLSLGNNRTGITSVGADGTAGNQALSAISVNNRTGRVCAAKTGDILFNVICPIGCLVVVGIVTHRVIRDGTAYNIKASPLGNYGSSPYYTRAGNIVFQSCTGKGNRSLFNLNKEASGISLRSRGKITCPIGFAFSTITTLLRCLHPAGIRGGRIRCRIGIDIISCPGDRSN